MTTIKAYFPNAFEALKLRPSGPGAVAAQHGTVISAPR
jgi:hypothetical protein